MKYNFNRALDLIKLFEKFQKKIVLPKLAYKFNIIPFKYQQKFL